MVKKTIATIFVLLNEENNPAAKFYPKSGLKLKMSGANFGMLLTEIIKVQCEDQDTDQAGHIGYFAALLDGFCTIIFTERTSEKMLSSGYQRK